MREEQHERHKKKIWKNNNNKANKYRNDCVHIIQWRKEWREQVECAAESCAQN